MARTNQFLKNLQQFRLVTFDITDTLLKFKTPPEIQYAKTAALIGYPNIDKQKLASCFRKEFKEMTRLHPNFGYATANMSWQQWWIQLVENIFSCVDSTIPKKDLHLIAETLFRQYRCNGNECWTLNEGAIEIVRKVKESGKVIGVISNFDPSLSQILETLGLNNFDFVLTSYECGISKPDKRIFQIPLQKCKLSANEALHIGNLLEIDYVGARNAGWSSLLLSADYDDLPKGVNRAHTFTNLFQLINSLEESCIKW